MGYYESLGVRPLINASARLTRLGGSLLSPAVLAAMSAAAAQYVDLYELHAAVGRRLAVLTHNEAAYVCAGAAAGLALATLACMAGTEPSATLRLPVGDWARREIIIHCAHRIPYDHAIRLVGGTLVQIGSVLQTFDWELDHAINEHTAAVLYIAGAHLRRGALPLETVVAIAHARNVPVIVDAAAQLPPVENLWYFTRDLGADLAVFSGGKDLCGPQASGLIVGRPDLIAACAFHSAPYARLGRAMKTGKEEIIGLLAAVEQYLLSDHHARAARFEAVVAGWVAVLGDVPGVCVRRDFPNEAGQPVPRARIDINPWVASLTGPQLVQQLWDGDPRIAVDQEAPDTIWLTPDTVEPGDEQIIAARIIAAFAHSQSILATRSVPDQATG